MHTSQASVQDLARWCRQEAERFRAMGAQSIGACLELFRRAIVECCQEAWQAIYVQYKRQVLGWIGGSADDREDLLHIALEKFRQNVTADTFDRYDGIDKLLAYLKRCARSAPIDASRRAASEKRALALWGSHDLCAGSPEPKVLDRIQSQQFAEFVRARLNDDLEKRVIYLSFEQDLKPAEIARCYPADFASSRAVSRIKERVLLRLAHDPVLKARFRPPK